MKRSIILVYPKSGIYDTMIKDLPLSLLYVATVVHQHGYHVKIIDQRVESDWREKLIYELQKKPLCVGISVMTGAPIKFALKISDTVKQNSDTPVVWGGIHPTIMPQQTMENELVDVVVKGEGEHVFFELVEALAQNKTLEKISGISYKVDGRIFHNGFRESVDLDTLPDLPYELVDITNYYRKGYDERVVSVMTSRGCPHNCAFCYCPATSRRLWRKMTVEKAVNVIRTAIEKFNPGYICILDDDFFVDLERAKRIIYEIKKFGWKVKFDFRGVRIDDLYRLDDTTLSLLEEIGTRNLHIGAESGSQRMLNLMKKGIQVSQTVIVNQRLRSFPSLRPTYNFFSGLPTETEEDIFKSTDLVFQLLRENPHCHMTLFNQFTPYPGSELFEMSMRYGYKPPKTLRDWGDFGPENSARIMPWLSRRMVKLLDTLYITCFFIDKKLDIHFVSNKFTFQLLKVLIRIYRPFARMRFKKHLTVLPLEVFLRDIFFSFLKRKTEYEAEGYFKAYFKFDPSRIKIWREIAKYLNKNFIKPDSRILDLGAGYCDFINNIKAKEKYALDIFSGIDKFAAKDVHLFKQTANEKIDLASDYLDVVFSSNFFEHLNPVELDRIFAEVRRVLRNNGLLIIIQPNYRYFTRQYFQDPTHKQTFDESSLASFLQQRGFQVIKNVARFLPASFKSFLPKNQFLCRLYLNSPIKPFAKQFFIVASNLKS